MKLGYSVFATALVAVVGLTACSHDAVSPDGDDVTPIEAPAVALVAVAGNGQVAPAGAEVQIAPRVVARDADGRPVAGVVVSFVISAAAGGTVPAGEGAVTPNTRTTGADGVAGVGSWKLGHTTGTYELTAMAPNLPSVRFEATAIAAAPALITVQSGASQSATVGTAVPVRPSVLVRDAFGNTVANASVTFAVTAGGGSITGAVVLTSSNGVATLGSWTLGTTAGNNTISAAVGGAESITISATGVAGTVSSLGISSGNNQNSTAALAVPIAPTVVARDAFGNSVAAVPITFSIISGAGTATGTSTVTGSNGLASVGSWTLGAAIGENVMRASSTGVASVNFVANAISGTAASISIQDGNAQTAHAGTNVSVLPKVTVRDALGNPVVGISVGFQIVSGNGSVDNALATTNSAGIATLAGWRLGEVAGSNTLSATVSGVASVLFTATGTPGPVAQLAKASIDNVTGTVGTAVLQPAVVARNAFGNLVSGATIVFTVTSGNGSATGTSPLTNGSGMANVGSWTIGTVAGVNTLRAASGSATPVTFTVTGIAGAAAALVKVAGDLQFAKVGTAVPIDPVVLATDEFGNAVSGVAITFAVSGGGGAINTAFATSGSNGRASSGGWRLGVVPGANTLTATANFGGGAAVVSFTATALAGNPGLLQIVSGNGQHAVLGAPVPIAPTVRVIDGFSNPVAGVTVSFAVMMGGGSITGATAVTNALGVATVGSWTLGVIPGMNVLRVTAPNVNAVTFHATGAGLLVAVGGFGAGGTIRTSLDGLNWVEQESPFTDYGRAVAYNGSTWLAGAQGSVTMARSNDAITWTAVANPLTSFVNSMAWNGSMWVAVGGAVGGGVAVATSTNGSTWTARPSPFDGSASFGTAIAWNGTLWVAGGTASNGDPGFATSTDGITWTARPGPFNVIVTSIAWNGSLFVATGLGGTSIATSPDGITWTARSAPFSIFGSSVAWNGNMWIAVGGFDPATSIATSVDGITWTPQASAFAEALSVTWTGLEWVAVGRNAMAVPISGTSQDGVLWTTSPAGFSALATAVGWRRPY